MSKTIPCSQPIPSIFLGIACLVTLFSRPHLQADEQIANQLCEILYQGRSEQGEIDLEKKLALDPKNETVLASLGAVRFVRAVEELSQEYYRFGMEPQRGIANGNMLLQKTANPNPEPISYLDARGILERFEQRLMKAEKTLSEFRPVGIKLPIEVALISLDVNHDGKSTGNVLLSSIIVFGSTGNPNNAATVGDPLIFAFDDADILWLRGYIHVLLGTINIALAHDWQDAFERTSHLFFEQPKTSYLFLLDEGESTNWSINQVADLIAWIHVLSFDVVEPKRMLKALDHLEQVVSLSRDTWKLIREEKDNDREWLPGPTQNSVILQGRIGGRLGNDWEKVLDRTELVLQGKELIPFWRGYKGDNTWQLFNGNDNVQFHPELGINLRKVFTEPQKFDLVLWLQGTGVAPFLEKGTTIDLKAWQDLSQSFGGQLPFFSIWIN